MSPATEDVVWAIPTRSGSKARRMTSRSGMSNLPGTIMSGVDSRRSLRRHRVPGFRKDVKAVQWGEESRKHDAQRLAERRPMITARWSYRKLNHIPGLPLIDRWTKSLRDSRKAPDVTVGLCIRLRL